MKTIFNLLSTLLLCTYLLGCTSSGDQEKYTPCPIHSKKITAKNNHIILIVGQSNTHSGIGLDTKIDTADKRIKQLSWTKNGESAITKATIPLDHPTLVPGKIGFGTTFSNLYAQAYLNNGDTIFIIPCGYGGSGFSRNNWNKGDLFYNKSVQRTLEVLKNHPNSSLTAILWHQGESDVMNPSYEATLNLFIQNIRNDLGYPDVPFILGGMVPYWTEQNEARTRTQKIIEKTALLNKNTGYANPYIPFVIQKEDDEVDEIHYSAAGQRELGKRYFEAFNCVVNKLSSEQK